MAGSTVSKTNAQKPITPMAAVPFHYVDLRTFCYATEDERRVERALRSVLPDDVQIERMETEGHYGDRILVFSARVENADDIRYVLDRLEELEDRRQILDELDERVDENCSLFLSLDKQRAFSGDVALGDGIMLRAKVEAYPAKRGSAIENVRPLFE